MEGCSEPVNICKFTSELLPSFSTHQNSFTRIRNGDFVVDDDPFIIHSNDQDHGGIILDPDVSSWDPHIATDLPAPYTEFHPDGEIDEASDDCLKFISEILMEEDLDDQTVSLHDFTALQATEKSLYDALGETFPSSSDEYPSSVGQNHDSPEYDDFHHSSSSSHRSDFHQSMVSDSVSLNSNSLSNGSCDYCFSEVIKGLADSPASTLLGSELMGEEPKFDWFKEASQYAPIGGCNHCFTDQKKKESDYRNNMVAETGNRSRGRKNLTRDDIDDEEGDRRSKHLATDANDEDVQMEQYDDVLLCKEDGNGNLCCESKDGSSDDGERGTSPKGSKKKKTRSKKKSSEGEVVDLMTLLTQCAQAVASFDLRNANELVKQIRLHSSQYGDNTQRVAHYLANALEARLAGTGWQQYREFGQKHVLKLFDILKAYKEQVCAIPFRRASYFVANNAIAKLADKATRVHVIDFGIFYGFQWPGLIQKLSKRTGGPPMLRITGIDYPERGFRPAQKVEETGRRLAGYCKRFKVPFEYQPIAKNWEDITPQDINIEKDELVVVNCLYMARKLVDETVEENNPRDSFLRLIRKLNPDLFIKGIVNGTFNAPFFVTRFKEALFHYSAIFDMFEATLPRESEERMLVESHLYGRDALNVIACEGVERVERPETFRQWQVRIQRAGFRKLPLDYECVKRVKSHVKWHHHKDFVIDDDSHWMLQGWKGRILYAVSCWRPV